MKTTIRLIVPGYGWDFVEVEYKTNPVGSKTLYSVTGAWQSYRGERAAQIDVDALLRFNPYEEVEEAIVAKTQGSHRAGLEADAMNPRVGGPKKFAFNKKANKQSKSIPD